MAYAKKASRRYRRRPYRKRYYKRRWARSRYRRKYRKRYSKRPEYKRIEGSMSLTYSLLARRENIGTAQAPNIQTKYLASYMYGFYVIGTGTNPTAANVGIDIPVGADVDKRIGAKISPARIKFYISMSMMPYGNTPEDQDIGLFKDIPQYTTQAYAVRFIVMQVRSGRGTTHPANYDFTNINPSITGAGDPDVGFFNKAFVSGWSGNISYEVDDYGARRAVFNTDQFMLLQQLMRSPYRRGLGGQFKILKDKTYTLNTTKNFINFSCRSKKPDRMVWVEERLTENQVYSHPRNPIYIIAIPCGSSYNWHSVLQFQCRYEFVYSDF